MPRSLAGASTTINARFSPRLQLLRRIERVRRGVTTSILNRATVPLSLLTRLSSLSRIESRLGAPAGVEVCCASATGGGEVPATRHSREAAIQTATHSLHVHAGAGRSLAKYTQEWARQPLLWLVQDGHLRVGQLIVSSWRASGETARQYASNHGLSAGTLKWWSRRVSKQAAEPTSPFAKVVVKPPAVTGSELEVVAPSGHRVCVRHAQSPGASTEPAATGLKSRGL